MATEDRNETVLSISHERLELARNAAVVLAQVAGPLQYLTAGHADAELDAAHQLAVRMEELAQVVITALNDPGSLPAPDEELAEARAVFLGPEMHRRRVREIESA